MATILTVSASPSAVSKTAFTRSRVDAALTDLGQSLLDPIKHLKAWAEDHVPEVRDAQEAYDQAQESAS